MISPARDQYYQYDIGKASYYYKLKKDVTANDWESFESSEVVVAKPYLRHWLAKNHQGDDVLYMQFYHLIEPLSHHQIPNKR